MFFRIGEAAVPGPAVESSLSRSSSSNHFRRSYNAPCQQQQPDQVHQDPLTCQPRWHVGAINPTGLASKGATVNHLPCGIYAVSESQLSSRGIARFKRELAGVNSPFQFTHGAPAPLQSQGLHAVAGTQTGVGFLSTFPCRPIAHGWNEELYNTGRIHAATFQVGSCWIGGGVIYGQTSRANTNEVKGATNQLLQELTRQLIDPFPGPSFIAGDWNQEPGVLEEANLLVQRGWVEIQTWAETHLGMPPGPTCKFVTRKDHVMISPELQKIIKAVYNEFDHFPDHSTLYASMLLPAKLHAIPRWLKPKPIRYDHPDANMVANAECQPMPNVADPTQQYMQICQAFEQHVNQVRVGAGKPSLLDNQRGRGCTMQREMIQPNQVHLKPARSGDPQPMVSDWSATYRRWFTQLRRLVSLARACKVDSPPTRQAYQLHVWAAICRAPGFQPDFGTWWKSQHEADPQWPLPSKSFPGAEVIKQLQQCMQAKVSDLEHQINHHRVIKAKIDRANNPNLVFRDVQKARPVPVQVIVSKQHATVLEVVDEASVVVDDTSQFDNVTTLEARTGNLPVTVASEGQLWFSVPHRLTVGDTVVHVEATGQVDEIHDAFISEWSKRWDKHRHVPPDKWDEVVRLAELALRAPQMELQPITVERWVHAIRSKKHTSATGMDAVSRADCLAMTVACHTAILQLFQEIGRAHV